MKTNYIQQLFLRTLQVIGHLFVFGIVGATGFLLWTLLERHRSTEGEHPDSYSDVVAILTAVIINVIMLVFPLIFRFIGRLVISKQIEVFRYCNF